MLDCLQMESAFSETRHAAGLLQQFSGFPFCRNDVCFFPLSLFSATHRTRSCPAALYDLHGVFICPGTLDRFTAASWRYFSGVYHLR